MTATHTELCILPIPIANRTSPTTHSANIFQNYGTGFKFTPISFVHVMSSRTKRGMPLGEKIQAVTLKDKVNQSLLSYFHNNVLFTSSAMFLDLRLCFWTCRRVAGVSSGAKNRAPPLQEAREDVENRGENNAFM